MANIFQLKRSSVAGKQPNISDLQVGELAVNLADGILYSKNTTGNIIVVGSSTTSNVIEGSNLYFTTARVGTAVSSQTLTNATFSGELIASTIVSNQSSGDEGGQLDLAAPQSNTTISGRIAVDVYQNKLRIFETTGSNRGVFIDFSAAANGVGSNLLTTGGAVDSVNGQTGTVVLTTANITESVNLYFTNTRAVSALTGGSGIAIGSNGLITATISNEAIATVSNVAPSPATQGKLYWDSEIGRLFVYYVDNDSQQWVDASPAIGDSITNIQLNDGNVAYPSLSYINDVDLGLYREGSNQLGISVNGVKKANINSQGVNVVGGVYATSYYGDGANLTGIVSGVTSVAGASGSVSNTQLLAGIIAVDGAGSNLDADTLDGFQSNVFAFASDLTTANVTELTNLYFTNTRAISAFTGGSGMTIDANGLLTVSVVGGVTSVAGATGAVSNAQLLAGLLNVDGVGSSLDADLLDGLAGGGSGFYALKANNLSVFANTTSAQLANVITDGTGSGNLVFAISPTLAGTPQAPTAISGTANTMIATTAFAANASNLSSGIVNPSRISGSYTGITGVGTIAAGTWQGSSISTTYTDAKVTNITATTPIVANVAVGSVGLSHATSGVSATTYGGATNIPVFTVNSFGHITSASNVSVSSGGLTVANTASSSTHYVIFTNSSSGSITTGNISIPSLYFIPSTGSLNAINFNSLSDITLKDEIRPIENHFDIINKINPVEFKWKNNNNESYGVIAQELESVLPHLVETNQNGIKSVSYIPLISVLISCIKDLKQEINTLKNKSN